MSAVRRVLELDCDSTPATPATGTRHHRPPPLVFSRSAEMGGRTARTGGNTAGFMLTAAVLLLAVGAERREIERVARHWPADYTNAGPQAHVDLKSPLAASGTTGLNADTTHREWAETKHPQDQVMGQDFNTADFPASAAEEAAALHTSAADGIPPEDGEGDSQAGFQYGWLDEEYTEEFDSDDEPEAEDILFADVVSHARRLQYGTCSTTRTTYGSWSGSRPSDPAANTGWSYSSNYWYLSCSTGYYRTGRGRFTCQASRYCSSCRYCCRSSWRGCSSYCYRACNCGSISYSAVSLDGSCAQCNPAAGSATYAVSPSYRAGVATYTFSCGTGAFGSSTSRTCSTYDGSWSGSAPYCRLCSPPIAANAYNPTVSYGTASYSWSCRPGYYANPVTRTCSSTDGSWSGSAIVCNACSPPVPGTDVTRSQASADTWTYTCNPGTYGVTQSRSCSTTTGGFTGVAASCSVCGAGYYCTGGNNRVQCPGGTWYDSSNQRLTTSSCSGKCAAGHYCPVGSTSQFQNRCGGANKYCPAGSAAPISVSDGYYTTPLSAPGDRREGVATCPSNRQCKGGLILPPVDFGVTCPNGTDVSSVKEDVTYADFGTAYVATAVGCATCTFSWTIVTVSASPASCRANTSMFTFNTATSRLRVGPWQLRGDRCNTIFLVQLRATRVQDTTLWGTCNVTVNVEDVNEAPSMVSGTCSSRSVMEHSAVGTKVGSPLQASDPDVGQSLIWSVDHATPSIYPFTIGACDGQITVSKSTLDAAVQSTWTLPIKVSDVGLPPALSATCSITITVTDANDPPSVTTTVLSIYENSPVNALAGNIGATDPDRGTTLSISWSRTDSPDVFSIDNSGNVRVKTASIDYEEKNVYYYRVRVSDGTNVVVTDITINILDANDAPVVTASTRSIRENSAAGTMIAGGPIAWTDQDAGDTVSFSVTPTGTFTVNGTGHILVATGASINYEAQSSYALSVTATDSRSGTGTATVTINVIDVNEAPSFTDGSSQTRNVQENSAVGANVGSPVAATDPDSGTVLVYRIQSVTPTSTLSWWSIDGLTGQLRVAKDVLDYESGTRQSTVVVNVTDSGVPALASSTSVVISVTDVDEPPKWSATTFSVNENSPPGTIVGTASAPDPEGGSVSYSLQGGSAWFNVTSIGRVIVASDVLDYESTPSFTLNIIATDGNSNSATGSVTVNVNNLNEAPTFDSSANERTVSAGASSGTRVGSPVRATDPDAGQVITYSVSANSYFSIDSETGQLSTKVTIPDPETGGGASNYSLTVTAKDNGSPQLTGTVVVLIQVSSAPPTNRPPTLANGILRVSESVTIGSTIANISRNASDPDGNSLSFALSNSDTVPFSLASNGILTLIGALDYETRLNYTLWVTVTDNPPVEDPPITPMSTTARWTVVVEDANEACTLSGGTFAVDENSPINLVVSSILRATDPDANDAVTYSISSGNTGSVFGLQSTRDANATQMNGTRVLISRAAINFESVSAYNLDITARDKGGLTCTARVDITVNNKNDPPVLQQPSTISIAENLAVGSNVGSPLSAADEDGDSIGWEITAGNSQGRFAISAVGQLTLASAVNYEMTSSYSLTVRVTDGKGGQDTKTFTVQVTDVPEAPTYTGATSARINENSRRGTFVFRANATDPDFNEVLTYALTSGNNGNAFAIDANTGNVTVFDSTMLDYETRAGMTLEVTVTDSTGLTAKKSVQVDIVNVNEAPVIVTDVLYIRENSASGTYTTTQVVINDPDAGDLPTIAITAGNSRAGFPSPLFSVAGLYISLAGATIDYENATTNSWNITLTATDTGSPQLTHVKTIRILAIDQNESPRISAGTRYIDENSPVDTGVVGGPVEASDPDVGQTLAYSITDGNTDGFFKIDSCSGQLKVAKVGLDFESNVTYSLTVRVQDDGGDDPGPARLSASAVITVIVRDVNERCSTTDQSVSIAENSAVNTAVGTRLTGSDPDVYSVNATWRTLSCSLASNPRNMFNISASACQLNVARNALDYEDPEGNSIPVLVTLSDGPGLSCQSVVTVQITDINEPPIIQTQTRSIREATEFPNNPLSEGAAVGSAVSASDPDNGQTSQLVFAIERVWPAFASSYFAIERSGVSAGRLTVALAGASNYRLDYETLPSIILLINVTDPGGLASRANVTVSLLDQNENPKFTDLTRSVLENATIFAPVGAPLNATDPENTVLAFSIIGGNTDNVFDIDSLTGQLRIRDPTKLDYESRSLYSLTVKVADTGMPGNGAQLTATATITVNVLDCNDAPSLSTSQTTFDVDENAAVGTVVGSVTGTDPDAGDVLAYYLISQDNTTQNEQAFAINSTTGELSVRGQGAGGLTAPLLDFESKRNYAITVMVRDRAGANATSSMTIRLGDVAEAPKFTSTRFEFSVAKNARFGTEMGTATASDVDAGDTLTWSIDAGNSNGTTLFGVAPASGAVRVVRNGTSFLPLAVPHRLRLVVTDSTGLSDATWVWITIVDSNDPPTMPDYNRTIAENSAVNASVGAAVTGSDNDPVQTLTYSIISGNIDDIFWIEGQTGRIRVNNPILDFESRSRYVLVVQCQDNGVGRLAASGTVTITVTDVGENPSLPATMAMDVDENSAVGTVVGTVTGSDVDAADQGAGKLQYSLVTSTSVFTIASTTGVVTVAAATLDFESVATYRLTVRVTDTYGLTKDGSLVISVNNRNDRPTVSDASATVAENSLSTTIATAPVSDQDVGQQHTYVLTRPQQVCWFHSVTSSNVDTFAYLPHPLPSWTSTQTIVFRAASSGTVKLSLRVPGSNNRYEFAFNEAGGKASVRRCTTFCSAALGGSVTSPSMASLTSLWVSVNRVTGALAFGTRDSNAIDATFTTLLSTTDSSTPIFNVSEIGVTATAAGSRISSICYDHPTASAGSLLVLNTTTGSLSTNDSIALDYEAQQQYGVEYQITDTTVGNSLLPEGLFEYGVMVINVQDVNERPTWPLIACGGGDYVACLSIPENSVAATRVGTLSRAVDPDTLASQTLSYKLQTDNNLAGAAAIFRINASSAIIDLAQAVLNYEDRSSYILTATATDSGSPALSVDAAVLVTITDVNEAPTIDDAVRYTPENMALGALIGDPLPATDPDFNSTAWGQLAYSIIAGGDTTTFGIVNTTGQIFVLNATLDFERQKMYRVRVRVTDGGALYDDAWLTVYITNVNEPPVIRDAARNISEAAVFPAPAGLPIPASDPDEGTILTYSIIGGTGAALFRINRCSGQIELASGASLDFETTQSYTLQLMVEDDGVPMLNATAWANITILDANEAAWINDAWRNVTENAAVGTLVGPALTAYDVDIFGGNVPWYTLTWTIVSGNDRGIFAINNVTGQLSVVRSDSTLLNYENPDANFFSLLVRVTDQGGLFAQASCAVYVNDTNEAPFFTDVSMARRIDENTPRSPRAAGDYVGSRILAQDPDMGQTSSLQYAIVAGNELGHFAIVSSGANAGQIYVSSIGAPALDFERLPSYNLTLEITDEGRVRATDPAIPLSTRGFVIVSLNDRNEAPHCNDSTRFLWENATLRSSVGDVIPASDPEDAVLTFSIVSGNNQGVFSIDSASGQLSVGDNTNLNYEATTSYSLTLSVRDSGTPEGPAQMLTATCRVDVTVGDVNEPPSLAPATFSIPENTGVETIVGSMAPRTSDPDAVETFTYSIVSQDLNTAGQQPFAINASTGVLLVAAQAGGAAADLDYEDKRSFAVLVRVSDKGGLSATATATVTLTNVNEPVSWVPNIPQLYARALEQQTVGPALITYVRDADTSVPSTGERFTFAFGSPSGNNDSTFGISPTDGQLSVVNNGSASFRYPPGGPGPVYYLRVVVTDAGVDGVPTSAEHIIVVNVTDNNRPPTLNGGVFYVDENSAVRTVVGTLAGADRDASDGQVLTYSLSPAGANINRAFPFNITTVPNTGTDNVGTGVITVIWDGPVDYEAPIKAAAAGSVGFNVYNAIVSVTDSHVTHLSASAPIQIIVRDVPEAPYFHPNRVANSGAFVMQIEENAPHGAQLRLVAASSSNAGGPEGGLRAFDEDYLQDHGNLTYSWHESTSSSVAALFELASTTGVVTVSSAGAAVGALNFEDVSQYTLTVVARDVTGLTDTASVTVRLVDVNEAPFLVGTGLRDMSSAAVSELAVTENAAAGVQFGRVVAGDADAGVPGQLSYSLLDDSESVFFGIVPHNGTLFVRAAGLDWEDKPVFRPTAVIKDGGSPSLNVTLTFTVTLSDVNDVTITGFRLAPGEAALGRGVDIVPGGTDAYSRSHATMQTLVQTPGGARVIITGTNFGRTSRRLADDGVTVNSSTITATFGPTGVEYTALGCYVLTPNTELLCATPAGFGVEHTWRLAVTTVGAGSVAGSAASSALTGFLKPTITSVAKLLEGDDVVTTIPTTGNASLVVEGRNFGPATVAIRLTYGATGVEYVSPQCVHDVVMPHERVICRAAPGIGANLQFRLQVDVSPLQISDVFNDTTVRYTEPSIESLSASLMDTAGGESIVIHGTNFGPAGVTGIVAMYSTNFSAAGVPVYTASNCRIAPAAPHTQMTCLSAPGIGASLQWIVVVGGQPSLASTSVTSYKPPRITDLSGLGSNLAITEGGQPVIIQGEQFGPLTAVDGDGVPLAVVQPIARYGHAVLGQSTGDDLRYMAASCAVTVAHRQITCLTAPGTGKALFWHVAVGGQPSGIFWNETTNYHPPVIAYYSGPGSVDADTVGGEYVDVEGRNFGPLGTPIENATYGWSGTDFTTTASCSVRVAHTQVRCLTVVGAGAGLSWLITIDSQQSVAPTTAYAPPEVISFSGPGAQDASTDGGEVVNITGKYFSIQRFLTRVTYGPSGTEYVASDCRVVVDHVMLQCRTVPGTGRRLRWIVTVGAQTSAPSEATTSYAPPFVRLAVPSHGPTQGGTMVVLTGTNFALAYRLAQITIRINALGVAPPNAIAMDSYWSDTRHGNATANEVSRWITELASPSISFTQNSMGTHNVSFLLPEGFGASRELFIVVDGVPSNIVQFKYDAPQIYNVAPDRVGQRRGYLRVILEGINFCASQQCGSVVLDGSPVTSLTNYSHTRIVFEMQDTAPPGQKYRVKIVVDGVASAERQFRRPVPNFDSLVGQADWDNMDTRGGNVFWIGGVKDIGTIAPEDIGIAIGGLACTNMTRTLQGDTCAAEGIPPDSPAAESCRFYNLTCTAPAGVGLRNPIVILVPGGQSAVDPNFLYNYGAPIITDIVSADDETTSFLTPQVGGVPVNGFPTLGQLVVVRGRNFGEAGLSPTSSGFVLLGTMAQVLPLRQNHTEMLLLIPPGQGRGIDFIYSVGGQTNIDVPQAGPSRGVRPPDILVRYASPVVTGVAPLGGSTRGGSLLTITGANFGTIGGSSLDASLIPRITIAGVPCVVPANFAADSQHAMLRCITPAGQGTNLPVVVSIANQSTTSTVPYSYAPPKVFAVTPSTGPTSGRTFDGVQINMTLYGDDLGLSGSGFIVFRQLDAGEGLSDLIVPESAMLFHNHTMMVFPMPEGAGAHLSVHAVIAGQTSAETVAFAYAPPSVYSFRRADMSPSDCTPRIETIRINANITVNRTRYMDCYRTDGGYPLEIVGESFSRTSGRVTIGGKRCELASQSHNRIVCYAPIGLGDRNPVVVTVGGRSSLVTNATLFAYDPPFISTIMPNVPDATGEPIDIRGYNFGHVKTDLSISLGGLPCISAEWLSDTLLQCKPVPDVVGPKNVSVLVANRTQPYVWYEVEQKVIFQCKKDWYGMFGEWCIDCDLDALGAVCPGNELYVDRIYADKGWWRDNVTTPSTECHALRQGRPACPVFRPCEPKWSCLGNNTCAEGYTDWRCSQCVKGKYYRMNGECVKCPNSPWLIVVGFLVGGLVACGVGWVLNKKNVSLALISIGVDYFQILSMFARTRIRWPALVKQIFTILSAFNFNIDLAAPECAIPDISFSMKWFFIQGLPLLAALMFASIYAAKYLYKRLCLTRKKTQLHSHLPQLVSTLIVMFRVLYLYNTRMTLDVFNCTPTDPPDGKQYMSGMLDVVCWQPGSAQVFLLPFAFGTLFFYTLGIPLAAVFFLRRKRNAVKYDQILRAKGTGDDRISNPKYYYFRKMWHNLYFHFKPGKWYWEFVILSRKALIAFTSLMFRNSPSYQLSMALLVLFAAYTLQVRHVPFMAHADKVKVVAEHESKILTDPLHATIEADMRALAKRNKVGASRRVAAFDAALYAKSNVFDAAVLSILDYNSVESVLLGSAILVNLMGIMFDSNRFSGATAAFYQSEYESITYGAILLIFLSIVYYLTAFVYDVILVCAPATAQQIVTCGSRSAAKRVKGGPRAGATKLASRHMETSAGVQRHADGDDAGSTGLNTNPFMIQQLAKAARDSANGAVETDTQTIISMAAPPDPTQWAHIRTSYASLASNVEDLRQQLRAAKRLAGILEVENDDGAATTAAAAVTNPKPAPNAPAAGSAFNPLARNRSRTQFTPTRADQTGAKAGALDGEPSAFGGYRKGVAVAVSSRLAAASSAGELAVDDGTTVRGNPLFTKSGGASTRATQATAAEKPADASEHASTVADNPLFSIASGGSNRAAARSRLLARGKSIRAAPAATSEVVAATDERVASGSSEAVNSSA